MMKLATLALTLAIPVSAGSMKDAPAADLNSGHGVKEFWESLQSPPTPRAPVRTTPVPVPVPYVYVKGFDGKRFRLPQALMDNYRLHIGQVISQALGRQLMKDLGAPYTPETMRFLNDSDPKETPQ